MALKKCLLTLIPMGFCVCPLKLIEAGEGSIVAMEFKQSAFALHLSVCIIACTYCRHMGLSLPKTILDCAVITILR